MGHKLVDEFKAFEGLCFSFVEALWVGCPNYSVRNWIILDFFCTGSPSDNILPQGFSIGLAE